MKTMFSVAFRRKLRTLGCVLAVFNLAVVLHIDSVLAQITKLTDKSAFSGAATALNFNDLPPGGDVRDLFAKVGVTFAGEGESTPRAQWVILVWIIAPPIDIVIRNEPAAGSSADRALILRFARPLRRVGFNLGNGTPSTVAEIEALTAKGEFLGRIQQVGVEQLVGPFVGLETSHPDGISTVVLDYGKDQAAEQIADLLMEFLSPRTFKTYLPQIVNGKSGNISFQTLIQIQSLLRERTQVQMKLFDQAGAPLPLMLDGQTKSVFDFTFTALGMQQLQTDGPTEQLSVGYGLIESNLPVTAHTILRVSRSDGLPPSETGVPAAEGEVFRVASVDRDPKIGLDTAIAVVNVGDAETSVEFRLKEKPTQPGQDPNEDQARFTLRPGEHRAIFLTELFGRYSPIGKSRDKKFQGRLVIWSREPAAVTILRTIGGLPSSSLAIGNTHE